MKKQTQNSLLKWASLLSNRPVTSLTDIQNSDTLILLLNKIQRLAFQQLYDIDDRTSNSASHILKSIKSYFKKQIFCNVSQLIDGLNIFKTPVVLWELLIGVAIKGKNRDANINIILQMDADEQAELMLLVEDVIDKLSQYDIADKTENKSQLSDSSGHNSVRNRKPSQFSHPHSKRDQFLNELIEQNELLKQKNIELHNELSHLKTVQQQLKKTYEDRLNHFKNERYQFLEALQAGSSTIESGVRSRNKSQFNFRSSINSSESKIFDDPLHQLNISITGSLPDIASDMLNAVKNLKKQTNLYMQKASILQDHNKDLKVSLNQLNSQNRHLKEQCQKALKMEKQMEAMRDENDELIRNQTELFKMIKELEGQKVYMRDVMEKLKVEKNELIKNSKISNRSMLMPEQKHAQQQQGDSKGLQLRTVSSSQKIDLMKAPSFILRQMGSQLQPQAYNLNEQIDDIKNPALKDKYQKQMQQLRERNQKQVEQLNLKYNQLRLQNNELKQVNKMLQKTINNSMEKSQQIQRNIEEGYKALFSMRSSIIQPTESEQKDSKQLSESAVSIKLPNGDNIWIEEQKHQHKLDKEQDSSKSDKEQNKSKPDSEQENSKILQFYQQVKKIVQSYEQKQLLMLIQIESLKKQLHDLVTERQGRQKGQSSHQNKQLNFKKSQISYMEQNEQLKTSKQDSVLMFNINVSGPGGQNTKFPENQQYPIRKSELQNSIPRQHQSQTKSQTKNKPSEQFIEIQEGEELNQNEFPSINYAKKSQNNCIRGSIDDRIGEHLAKDVFNKSNYHPQAVANLGTDLANANYMHANRMSTVSGIGLRFSKDQRRSFFAKSGFYNQSFIELSHKLQCEMDQNLQEISVQIDQKSNNNKNNKPKNRQQTINEAQQLDHNQGQKIRLMEQEKTLMERLERIKQSYNKIKQFHTNSAEEVDCQLKEQLTIQESQLTKLKVMNESLKQSLTLMLTQKQLTLSKMRELKQSIKKLNSYQDVEQLSAKFAHMFESVSELQLILPELQTRLDTSRTKSLELLYAKEKRHRENLEQQICILLETTLWFRNLAVDEQF